MSKFDYRTARAKALVVARDLPGNVTIDSNYVKTICVDGKRFIACASWKDAVIVLSAMAKVAELGHSYYDHYEELMTLHDGITK